jgi:hypothetical protein
MKSSNRLIWLIIGVLGAGLIALAVIQSKPIEGVQNVGDQGNEHIGSITDDHIEYNSLPPTSGPHIGNIAPWGVHTDPIPNEVQVHNLEDGGVMIQYKPGSLSLDEVERLTRAAQDAGRDHIVVAPYAEMEHAIALTAWNRLLPLESVDSKQISQFIQRYEGIDHHIR